MVLQYMVSDKSLESGELAPSENRVAERPVKEPPPKMSIRPATKSLKFWILLLANIIVFAVFYYRWTGNDRLGITDLLTSNRGMLRGILYHDGNPTAIVWGKIVHEGDTIRGYKVVKIYKDKVDFEKDGEILTEPVN